MKRNHAVLATIAVGMIALSGCSGDTESPPAEGGAAGDLDELIAAAQDEGQLTFYLTPPEATGQALSDAFFDEYGVEANFVRLTGAELATRYSSEAQAGAPVADLVMPSYDSFIDEGLQEGWFVPLVDADIPDFAEYPTEALIDDGQTAVVQYAPSVLSWNTEELGDVTPPESFDQLADSEYAGQVLLTDPSSSQAYLQFWTLMMEEYGIETVQAIADNQVRLYNSVVPMTESLVAGEGVVTGPNVGGVVSGAMAQGAPIDFSIPEVTTGPEIVLAVSEDAVSPNAARLFAHFVMSEEGAEIINNTEGVFSAYQSADLPAGYVRVDRDEALGNEEEILSAFGL
jgi:iron(III) transport system substrate-binding protein